MEHKNFFEGDDLTHVLTLIHDGQIDDAICACLRVDMSDEEIDEFLANEGVTV
jgi:hypothetical protein